jgi:FAD:protein FMN transferase
MEGFVQGTTYRIVYQNPNLVNLSQEINAEFKEIDTLMSLYNPHSYLVKINQSNDTVFFLPQKLLKVLEKSLEISQITNGAFDITVAPITKAYGFGPDKKTSLSDFQIDSIMQYVGYHNIYIKNDSLFFKKKGIQLDLNAIAQGYTTDVIAELFEEHGIKNYLIEVGGEIRTLGVNPDDKEWKIGVDKPKEGNIEPGSDLQAIIKLSGKSLATSGNYRKFIEVDGVKIVHTINPKTGKSVISNLLSTTVITDDCMTADAYATSLMVMGLTESIQFLSNQTIMEAYLVYSDTLGNLNEYYTNGFDSLLVKMND